MLKARANLPAHLARVAAPACRDRAGGFLCAFCGAWVRLQSSRQQPVKVYMWVKPICSHRLSLHVRKPRYRRAALHWVTQPGPVQLRWEPACSDPHNSSFPLSPVIVEASRTGRAPQLASGGGSLFQPLTLTRPVGLCPPIKLSPSSRLC